MNKQFNLLLLFEFYGGFFNNYTTPKTTFTRPLNNKKPEVNFNKLP